MLWFERATSLRRFFVVFLGLCSGANACRVHLQLRAAGTSPSTFRRPTAPGAENPRPPALDWWRGFGSRELTRLIEEAQTVESRHRRRHRPHHAGRRAEQDRRRAAAARPSTSPAAPPARGRRAARCARTTGRRSPPPTRSISGARTGRPRAPPRRPPSPPASPRKWSCSAPSPASPPPISRCWRRRSGCASRARTWRPPPACSP